MTQGDRHGAKLSPHRSVKQSAPLITAPEPNVPRRTVLAAALTAIASRPALEGQLVREASFSKTTPLLYMGLLQLAERLRKRELSPVEVTNAQLARIAALEPKLMAFDTITADRAIAQAKIAEREIRSGMPGASQEWKVIGTERNGLVNISREYGLPMREPHRAVAWLKTTISSNRKQTKKVDIGWTRELWVFVNGKLVYAAKNLFEVEGVRKAPDGRCSLENGAFPLTLEEGDNEVAVAIANNFFGWGLMLRLNDLEAVHLASN